MRQAFGQKVSECKFDFVARKLHPIDERPGLHDQMAGKFARSLMCSAVSSTVSGMAMVLPVKERVVKKAGRRSQKRGCAAQRLFRLCLWVAHPRKLAAPRLD